MNGVTLLATLLSGRRCGVALALLIGGYALLPVSGRAQPDPASAPADSTAFIDAVSLGIGVATYRGDLNAGLAGTSVGSMLRSGLDLYLGIERSFGPTYLGAEGGYSQVRVRDAQYGFSNRILRAELQGGIGVDWSSPHLFRFYSGIGFLNHRPVHADAAQVATDFETQAMGSARWSISVPFGVVINRRVRVALRWVVDDYLDNAEGDDQPYDFMIHVTIGHRIAFNN